MARTAGPTTPRTQGLLLTRLHQFEPVVQAPSPRSHVLGRSNADRQLELLAKKALDRQADAERAPSAHLYQIDPAAAAPPIRFFNNRCELTADEVGNVVDPREQARMRQGRRTGHRPAQHNLRAANWRTTSSSYGAWWCQEPWAQQCFLPEHRGPTAAAPAPPAATSTTTATARGRGTAPRAAKTPNQIPDISQGGPAWQHARKIARAHGTRHAGTMRS